MSTPFKTGTQSSQMFFWNRIQTRLIINFVFLAVISIVIVTGFTLVQVREQSNRQVFSQLESVAQIKQNQISEWLRTSETVLNVIKSVMMHHTNIRPLLEGKSVSLSSKDEINITLSQSVSEQNDSDAKERQIMESVVVYDLKGQIVSASDETLLNRVVTLQPYFQPSLTEEYIQSPYYDVSTGELTMMITSPIKTVTGKVVGVMAGRLNVDLLREVTAERSGLGETGETYFISIENNYMLTPSRFDEYDMTRAYHSEGIDRGLAAQDGESIYTNYQNPPVRVLGVYRWVPELNAALLAEISEVEAQTLFFQTSALVIGLTIIISLIAAVIGLIAATSIARPIGRLTQIATHIAGGNFSERATIQGRDEISVLGSAFNHMTDQLVHNINELDTRLDELNKTNDALRIATARAKEAARVKGEFLANVSHELRTPLNAIIGFSDMLLAGMSGPLNEKQEHKMRRLKENGTRLLTLINDLLDLTRIESGRLEMVEKTYSPRSLAERMMAQMESLALESKLKFELNIEPSLPAELLGDEKRVEQVIINLLSNAFKFTKEGSVTLSMMANPSEDTWTFAVTDTGIGIPPHAVNIIFEEFRQLDGSYSRAYQGSGLGLAITRNLVRMMGGKISVKSTLGSGSTFTVVLPLRTEETDSSLITEQVTH